MPYPAIHERTPMDNEQEGTNPMAEIKAMEKVAEAVTELDAEARGRVLRWAAERFSVSLSVTTPTRTPNPGGVGAANLNGNNGAGTPQFSDIAELFAAAAPESEVDKALVAGYWFQFGADARPEF